MTGRDSIAARRRSRQRATSAVVMERRRSAAVPGPTYEDEFAVFARTAAVMQRTGNVTRVDYAATCSLLDPARTIPEAVWEEIVDDECRRERELLAAARGGGA